MNVTNWLSEFIYLKKIRKWSTIFVGKWIHFFLAIALDTRHKLKELKTFKFRQVSSVIFPKDYQIFFQQCIMWHECVLSLHARRVLVHCFCRKVFWLWCLITLHNQEYRRLTEFISQKMSNVISNNFIISLIA